MLVSILYTLVFIGVGFTISWRLFESEGSLEKTALGIAVGLFLMMWLPAIFAFPFGFTLVTQYLALLAALLCAVFASVYKNKGKEITHYKGTATYNKGKAAYSNWKVAYETFLTGLKEYFADWKRNSKLALCVVLPLFILTAALLWTHILQPDDKGNLTGGQSTFGDLSLHAGMITSVSEQQFFPPNYSLMRGTQPVGYPFLCQTISSSLYTLGASLRAAYMIPMIFAALGLLLGVYAFLNAWLRRRGAAAAGTILFFVGGGFGFSYFFDLYNKDPEAQSKMSMLMTGFYTTPTNYTSQGVYWVNVIADLIIPQRATLFGWLILAPCLFLLVRAWLDGKKEYFAPLAVLAGGLPLIHTHSFLALGIISAVCILFAVWDYFKKREGATTTLAWFAFYGCAAVLLAAPQLFSFTFAQSSGGSDFVRFQFNWVNKTDNYFWFYIKNIGLPYLLMIPAFIHADLRGKRLFAGGLAILVICEFIVFQPNEYDNNKLLFIWYLLLCGITVTFLGDVFCSLRKSGVKGAWVSAALIVCVMNLSGVLTLVREIKSNHVLFGAAHVEAAEYIKENTLPGSLFLTSDNHLNTVAALTGRNILCGSGSFLHFHGVDYSDLRNWQLSLLGEPTMESLEEMGIDYVFASDYERGLDYFNEAFFEENCEIVFDNGIVRIYKVARLHDAITPS